MTNTPSTARAVPASRSEQALASSAHARINIPLNLDNWRHLAEDVQHELTWLHQWLLDNNIGWEDAEDAVGYSRANIFKILKGTYGGNMDNVAEKIRGLRRVQEERKLIQSNEFVPNSISRIVFGALDYAMANNSITMIVGESRSGKTSAARDWKIRNNHGRSVFATAPPYGGVKGVVRAIAVQCGINKNLGLVPMMDAVYRAFNPHRILILDEAHRCLPNDARTDNPPALEFLRDLHDQTHCALALISTKRLPARLDKGSYQYEQLIGRIGMPVIIPTKIPWEDIEPIVSQYIGSPSDQIMNELTRIANAPGRFGILVETLKVASRFASGEEREINNIDILKAIALRRQMSGGNVK